MPTASIIIIIAVFLAGLVSGGLFISWMLRRRNPAQSPTPTVRPQISDKPQGLVFRLGYVITPAILCAASIVTALAFAAYLPPRLAFRFDSNGAPAMYMSKYAFIIIMVTAQVLCAAAAYGIAEVVVRMGKSAFQTSAPQFRLEGMVSLMCNMILLPQIILAYIMADAFIYGAWSGHLFPIGIFSILTIAIGSLVIIAVFIRILTKARDAFNMR
jgi:hypothetical protein